MAALLALLGVLPQQAGAVITTACCQLGGTRSVTLRVGTAASNVVDTVTFSVGAGPVGNSQATGLPNRPPWKRGPLAATSGPIPIAITVVMPANFQPQAIITTVNSPAVLTCVSGLCAGSTIPFSSISWTVGATSAGDVQSGTFGVGPQNIQSDVFTGFTFIIPLGGTYTLTNTMTFTYANTTAYRAGQYGGTVVYTTTLP